MNYSLPNNATPGVYTVTSRLMSNDGTSQRDASFTRAVKPQPGGSLGNFAGRAENSRASPACPH